MEVPHVGFGGLAATGSQTVTFRRKVLPPSSGQKNKYAVRVVTYFSAESDFAETQDLPSAVLLAQSDLSLTRLDSHLFQLRKLNAYK
jgi:hypothetical protein